MESHHFIGSGLLSRELGEASTDPAGLLARTADLVAECGLEVVSDQSARFTHGGLTLVWILAESHLVMHLWSREGFATVDLHICDYRDSNLHKSRELVERLRALCFAAGSDSWREIHLDRPKQHVALEEAGA